MSADHSTLQTYKSRVGDAEAIIEAQREANQVEYLSDESVYGVIVPKGSSFEVVDPYKVLDTPRRKTGTYKVATVDSFIAYVKEHEAKSATTVWVHPSEGKVVAVIDDHVQGTGEDSAPGRREHHVALELIVADEWKHWKQRDGQLGGQVEFAEHLEDGAGEIVEPDAATLLEIAQSFHATTSAEFRSGQRLSNGEVKLVYEEETTATAGRSADLEIPQEFQLSIRPFLGEDPAPVLARLRYRVAGGSLRIGYKLDRPDVVVREVLDKVASRLDDELANVYIGHKPA